MEFSDKDWMGKNPPRNAQTNARKAIVRILSEEDECGGIGPENTIFGGKRGSIDSDMVVNVDIKVEMSPDMFMVQEDDNEQEEAPPEMVPNYIETNAHTLPAPEEPFKAKGIVATLAQKLNSKLNAVMSRSPENSQLDAGMLASPPENSKLKAVMSPQSPGNLKLKAVTPSHPPNNSKLKTVMAPRTPESLLECLEPEVSVAITPGDVYLCPWCPITFTNRKSHEDHKILCHPEYYNPEASPAVVHTCEVCGKNYSQIWDLKRCRKRHYDITTLHSQLRPFICVDCGEAFATAHDLSTHQKNHEGSDFFQCAQCEESFPSSDGLRSHMTSHADFICSICDERFQEVDALIDHTSTHIIDRCWVCPHCDRGFSTQQILVAHQHTHLIDTSDSSDFTCEHCKKPYNSKDKLEDHVKAHEEGRLCEFCYMVFPQANQMRKHMIKLHKAIPPRQYKLSNRKGRYKCIPCNKCYQFLNPFKRHVRNTHSLVKPYKCHGCGECFQDVEHLKMHQLGHSRERPPACTKCGEKFKTDDWSMHLCSAESLHECYICGKCFLNINNLHSHMRLHETKIASTLQAHMLPDTKTASCSLDDQPSVPNQSDQIVFADDTLTIKKVTEMAEDPTAFRAAIANKLIGTGVFTQQKLEANNFKDKIAQRLMGTGFVAQKKDEVKNFRDTIADRLKETGVLSFGNGNVSLSLLKVERPDNPL